MLYISTEEGRSEGIFYGIFDGSNSYVKRKKQSEYMDQEEGNGGYSDEGHGRRGRGGFGGGFGGAPKPVKTGDEVELKVEAVASKGDGIAKKDGFVIFIKGAKEGETVKVRISEVKERFAIGEIIS